MIKRLLLVALLLCFCAAKQPEVATDVDALIAVQSPTFDFDSSTAAIEQGPSNCYGLNDSAASTVVVNKCGGAAGTAARNTADFDVVAGSCKVGTCFDCYNGGTDDEINLGALTFGTGDLTFCAWIKPDTDGEGDAGRLFISGACDLQFNSNAYFQFGGLAIAIADITMSQWNHVCAIRQVGATNGGAIWVNGVNKTVVSGTVSTSSCSSAGAYLCGNGAGNRSFDGIVDEVRLYPYALSPNQVQAIYQGTHEQFASNKNSTSIVTDATGAVMSVQSKGIEFAQSTAANRCTLSTMSSRRVLQCDGVNDVYTSTATLDDLVDNNAKTVFMVLQNTDGTKTGYPLYDSSNDFFPITSHSANTGSRAYNDDGSVDTFYAECLYTPSVLTVTHDGTTMFWSDSPHWSSSKASGNTATMTGTMILGETWAGKIARITTFAKVLSANTRIAIDKGLRNRFGAWPWSIPMPYWHSGLNNNAATTAITGPMGSGATASANTNTFGAASGKIGRTLDFDGSAHKLDIGSDLISTGIDTFTAWVYVDGGHEGGSGRIVDNGKTILTLADAGTISFYSDGATAATSAVGAVGSGAWVHIAVTRTAAGVANIYVNGVLSGTADQASGAPAGGTTNTIIGNDNAGGQTFNGKLDDLRMYSAILTHAEINHVYNGGTGREDR